MKLITINYLANERTQYFKPIFNQLIKIKDENKQKINVNMLVSKPHDNNIDIKLLTDNGIEAQIIYLPDSGRHYMCKVENAVKIANKYIISLDEDVFLNNHIWDYMIENCDILDDDKNLLFSPLLSTGIPTVDWFIEQFFNEEERNLIFNKFKNTYIEENHCTPPGCGVLNKCTVDLSNKDWDKEYFYREVHKMETYYKGIHPVRVSDENQSLLVDMVLEHKDRLLKKMDYELVFNNDRPYFCNNIYMIKTSTYRKIIEDESLFVDKFDEVPVNEFRKMNNLNMVFIKNSFGVHPSYNWIGMERYTELADKFFRGMENE
jgi:hypothetical protein